MQFKTPNGFQCGIYGLQQTLFAFVRESYCSDCKCWSVASWCLRHIYVWWCRHGHAIHTRGVVYGYGYGWRSGCYIGSVVCGVYHRSKRDTQSASDFLCNLRRVWRGGLGDGHRRMTDPSDQTPPKGWRRTVPDIVFVCMFWSTWYSQTDIPIRPRY